MNADVEKAVERLDRSGIRGVVAGQPAFDDWETVRQALRDQEALLRKCLPFVPGTAQDTDTLYGRIWSQT